MAKRSSRKRRFVRIGPGGGGGQLRPTVHPSDPRVVFIACDMTGWYQSRDGGETWRNINLKGVVRCAAFDPSRPKVIYAGNSGLYRSTNLGASWRLVYPAPGSVTEEVEAFDHANHRYESTDNWPGGMILGIAVDPANSRAIHLAIYRDGPEAGEILIYSSRSGGRRFAPLARIDGVDPRGAMGDNTAVKFLYVDPDSPVDDRRLYAATPGGVICVSAAAGHVERLPLPPGAERIDHASVSRPAPAAQAGQARREPVFYVTATSRWAEDGSLAGGVFRSDDGGRSWRGLNAGLVEGVYRGPDAAAPQFTCVASAAGDPDIAYLECRRYPERPDAEALYGQPGGVLKTTDGGRSWRWVYRAAWDSRAVNCTRECWITRWNGPGGNSAIQLGVAPSDPDIVWRVTAMCSYRSTDGGERWQETYSSWRPDGAAATNGMDVTTTYGVHFDPHVPERIFISYTDIGLFRSEDGGRGWWTSRGGVPQAWRNTCYWMVCDPAERDRAWSVWSGCHDLPRPKMFGGDWSKRAGGVAFTGDGGKTWHPVTSGMPDHAVPTHILLDADSSRGMRRLYVAAFHGGVYRSDNDGRSWRLCNRGIDPANLYAWRLAAGPDGAVWLCVARGGGDGRGYVDGAVYRSDDRAESWRRIAMPEGTNAPNDLAVDPRDPRRIYLACWPRTVVAGADRDTSGPQSAGRPAGGGLWASDDGGGTWRNVLDERLHAYGVTIDPRHPDRLYVCGFNSAIFRSDDRGATWRRLGGYDFKWGHRVVCDPHDPEMIYVTTFGGSVFHGPAEGR